MQISGQGTGDSGQERDVRGQIQELDDDARRVDRGVGLAQRADHPFAAAFGGAEVDEQHLVFVVLDDLTECVSALGQIDRRELALEDRVLRMVAKVSHGLEDLAEAFIVADVVADEKGISHGRISPWRQTTIHGGSGYPSSVIGVGGDARKTGTNRR